MVELPMDRLMAVIILLVRNVLITATTLKMAMG